MPCPLATPLLIVALLAQGPAKEGPAPWLRRAESEAGAVADPSTRADLLGKVAAGFARVGDEPGYRRALDLMRRALAGIRPEPGLSPVDVVEQDAATSLIQTRAAAGDIRGAKALAEEFLKGRDPYRPSYLAPIAAAQAEAGDVDGALASAAPLDGNGKAQVLAGVAAALVRRGDDARARQVADSIRGGVFDSTDALEAVAMAQVDAGRFAAALKTADALPPDFARQAVYRQAAETQARRGDIPAALATAASVFGGAPAFADVAQVQIEKGDISGAKATIARVGEPFRLPLLREVALAELRAGRPADALRTAESIPLPEGRDVGITPGHPRGQVLRALAIAAARAGRFDEALRHADAFHDGDETRIAVAAIALELGKKDEARRVVDRLNAAPDFSGEGSGEGRAQRLAVLESRLGNPRPYERRARLFEARARGAGPGVDEARIGLMALHLGVGRFEEARQAVAKMPGKAVDPLLGWFAADAVARGDLAQAEQIASIPPDPAGRDAILAGIAAARLRRDGPVEAVRWVQGLPSPEARTAAFLRLAGFP